MLQPIEKILWSIGFRRFRGRWYPKIVLYQMVDALAISSLPEAHHTLLEIAELLEKKKRK